MRTLTVELGERRYDILLGQKLLAEPEEWLCSLASPERPLAVVTDENVWKYYGDDFLCGLHKAGLKARPVILPPGEENKSFTGLGTLYNAFAGMGLKRDGLVIALGGGVIGDLAGFAAATWMRGIRYVQVPTTLLAQVDSSVGGKTAIDLPSGKNMVGAFHQPQLVLIDPDTLKTLAPREMRCGLAEAIKYGAIRSIGLFETLEKGSPKSYEDIINECCSIKAGIVARDELDTGERALLNFGHSFGHAIESRYQYQRFNHGEAVALGMLIAAVMGEEIGQTEQGTSDRLVKLMTLHNLETALPCPPFELLPFLTADKKSEGSSLRMVLLRKIGDAFLQSLKLSEIESILNKAADKWTILS